MRLLLLPEDIRRSGGQGLDPRDDGLVPALRIDAVILCAAVSVDSEFLGLMQAYWFKRTCRLALDVPAPGRRRLPRRRLCAREAASATACTDPAVEP